MTDLERRLRTALIGAAAQIDVSPDAWQQHQQLLLDRPPLQRAPRSWLWPAVAAACAVAIAVGVVVGVRSVRSNTPPADRPTSPVPTGTPSAEQQFSSKYLSRCLAADPYDSRATKRGLVVRLVRKDDFGLVAVLTKTDGFLSCTVQPDGTILANSFLAWIGGRSNYLRYPVNNEYNTHPHPSDGPVPPADDYNLYLGRVAGNVARIEYVQGGRSTAATIGNGMYVVRAAPLPGLDGLRGYDATGALLYDDRGPLKIQHIPWR